MTPEDYYLQLPDLLPFPDNVVTLDFETFYDTHSDPKYSLRDMTIEAYVRDERFKTHGLSVKVNQKPSRWVTGHSGITKIMSVLANSSALFVAHNARFDGFILSEIYGVYPDMWADTMAMAAQVRGNNLPSSSLKNLARDHLPPALQKHSEALDDLNGVRDPTLKQLRALGVYAGDDTDMTRSLFDIYYAELVDE